MAGPDLEQVLQSLRALFAAEYHRGEQDAIARIMKAAQGAPASPNGAAHERPEHKRKEPAPKGTAKALIDRVLKERGQRGATPSEIKDLATTDTEKLASFAGIRFALTQGRDDLRYKNRRGKWFLVTPRVSHETELPKGDSR
jgi:hypothetical protein